MTPLFVIGALLGIGLLIVVHETGHFIVARLAGIKVEAFAIGIGPFIRIGRFSLKKRIGETDYGIAVFPFGGYVKLAGMESFEEVAPEDEPRTYRVQPLWKRFIVIMSGAAFNIILPTFIIGGILLAYGMPYASRTIDQVLKGTPASAAGLRAGDRIESVDGRRFSSWEPLRAYLRAHPGRTVTLGATRRGEQLSLKASLKNVGGKGFLGITPGIGRREIGFFRSFVLGAQGNIRLVGSLLVGYYRLVTGGLGPVSKSLSGPVGMTAITVESLRAGLEEYLSLLAVISVNLGIINLLPILPLDGGHLFFHALEAVRRKPVGLIVRQYISYAGTALLFALIIYVTVIDFWRLAANKLPGM